MTPLIAGPYEAPFCVAGAWVEDAVLGLVEVGGFTTAPIPWPRRKKTGRPSLILTGDLLRAVETESVEAIVDHWGVGATTVWSWRKALGVDRVTEGTRKLLQERTGVPPEAAAKGRLAALSPESIERNRAAHVGRPVSEATRANLLRAAKAPKPEGWGKRANAWMRAGKATKTED